MAVTVTDYADVEARAAELGLRQPDPLAILPRGFETGATEALVHESKPKRSNCCVLRLPTFTDAVRYWV
jgi:hypothetical protein